MGDFGPHARMFAGSLRSWRGFARECFCFGNEAVDASGEAVSRVESHSRLRRSRVPSRA